MSYYNKKRYSQTCENPRTLSEHLQQIETNRPAGHKEFVALSRKVKYYFFLNGYKKSQYNPALTMEYVKMIFEIQDFRCTHDLPTSGDQVSATWNAPGKDFNNWKTTDVVYEVDHIVPVNSGGDNSLENLQFLSGNANRYKKCSMTYDYYFRRVDVTDAEKERIRSVLKRREALLSSQRWLDFKQKLEDYEKTP
jgi:hypothetical protein